MRHFGALVMTSVFLLGGFFLFAAGKQLIWLIERGSDLKRAQAEIVGIETEKRGDRRRSYIVQVPIISFQTDTGETIVFRGQVAVKKAKGEAFRIGEKIDVIYDPENWRQPEIDTVYRYLDIPVTVFFGLVFTGASVLFFKFLW